MGGRQSHSQVAGLFGVVGNRDGIAGRRREHQIRVFVRGLVARHGVDRRAADSRQGHIVAVAADVTDPVLASADGDHAPLGKAGEGSDCVATVVGQNREDCSDRRIEIRLGRHRQRGARQVNGPVDLKLIIVGSGIHAVQVNRQGSCPGGAE